MWTSIKLNINVGIVTTNQLDHTTSNDTWSQNIVSYNLMFLSSNLMVLSIHLMFLSSNLMFLSIHLMMLSINLMLAINVLNAVGLSNFNAGYLHMYQCVAELLM